MIRLLGSSDYNENPILDFCVTLMCDYQNNLIAYANNPSRLALLKVQNILIYLNFGVGFWFIEFPENLLAKDGYEIPFESAIKYFPYLKDENFWIDEKWLGYNGVEYKKLLEYLFF